MKKHVFTENAAIELLYNAAEQCGLAEELAMLDYTDAWDRATEFACEYDPTGDNASWHAAAEALMTMYGPDEPEYAEDVKNIYKAGLRVVKEDRNSKSLLAIFKLSDILEKTLEQIKKVKIEPIENINECEDATSAVNTCAAHLKEIAKVIKTVKGTIPEVSIPDQAAYQAASKGELGGEEDSEPAPAKDDGDETVEVTEESVQKKRKMKEDTEIPCYIYEQCPDFDGYLTEQGELTNNIENAQMFYSVEEAEAELDGILTMMGGYVTEGILAPEDFEVTITDEEGYELKSFDIPSLIGPYLERF